MGIFTDVIDFDYWIKTTSLMDILDEILASGSSELRDWFDNEVPIGEKTLSNMDAYFISNYNSFPSKYKIIQELGRLISSDCLEEWVVKNGVISLLFGYKKISESLIEPILDILEDFPNMGVSVVSGYFYYINNGKSRNWIIPPKEN